MGIVKDLFISKEPYCTCSICGKNQTRDKLKDGHICADCKKRYSRHLYPVYPRWADITVAKVQRAKQNEEMMKVYKPVKKIEDYLGIDDENKLFQLYDPGSLFRYEELVSWELVQNEMSIIRGGIRKETDSVVAGAVIMPGRVYKLEIHFITRNIAKPEIWMGILRNGPVQYGSWRYSQYMNTARQILAELEKIAESLRPEEPAASTTILSGADEIVKYKNLLDQGIITPEEFEAKKKQILAL